MEFFFPLLIISFIFESYGFLKMSPLVFGLGISAFFKEEIVHEGISFKNIGETGQTEFSKYSVVAENQVLFCYTSPPLKFRTHTPFLLKGTVHLEKGTCRIKGRTPLTPTIFFVFWFGGLIRIITNPVIQSRTWPNANYIYGLYAFFVVGFVIVYFSLKFERKRLLKAWEEVRLRVL